MKLRIQKLFALLTALVLCVGMLVFPASATIGDAGDYIVDQFWAFARLNWDDVDSTPTYLYNVLKELLHSSLDKTPEEATDADWQNVYNQYVTNIQNNYGSSSLRSDGALVYPIYPDYSAAYTLDDSASVELLSASHNTGVLRVFRGANTTERGIYVYIPYDVKSLSGLSLQGQAFFDRSDSSGIYRYLNGYGSNLFDFAYGTYNGLAYVSSNNSLDTFRRDVVANLFGGRIPYISFNNTYCNRFSSDIRLDRDFIDVTYTFSSPSFFYYIPLSAPDLVIDSRVGTNSGNFGYYGDDGQLVVGENVKIVDETNNNYYNPVTGTTTPIVDWTYDYGDRSYTLDLEGELSAEVVFGDKNIVIKEGDTTYNVYYVTQGGGSGEDPTPSPSPSTHVHDYTSKVTTEPSCLTAGVKTYTCSACGDTYTEKIPATGHTWVMDRTVNTTYDENGNVTQQGYTIYKCSVCGNEYKDETGSGPPDGGGGEEGGGFLDWLGKKLGELLGAIGDGIIGLIQTALGKILDGLIAIVNMISDKLNTVVEAIFKVFDEIPGVFTGFTDFMSAVFAFVPPEIITIITFGILAVVLVAIIKHFIG